MRYLAPEAAGAIAGALVDERADLYSVGVLLFECLVGRPPFEGKNVGEVLRQHLSAPAAPLRTLRAGVPRALDAAVQRLLRKAPDERYQSAAAVLADLEAVVTALARGVIDPAVVVGLHDRRQALTEPAFVGRTAELAVLSGLLDEVRAGRGRLVLLEAESGRGKSRLLDELAPRSADTWSLRGQGVDQAARRPFQVLEGMAAGIASALADDPGGAERLRSRVGDRADAVVAALPALGPILTPQGVSDAGPEAYGEVRSVGAISALLDALGDDDLTRLANRGLFSDRIEHALAGRSVDPVAVVFMDLDDFKGINDTFGQAAGDTLLRSVARRLLTCVRPHDTVARLGGDEFAILLERTQEAQAERVAERVLAAMAPAFDLGGQQVQVRCSVGLAVRERRRRRRRRAAQPADAAMYVAKAAGKGRYQMFEPSMRVAAIERVTIKTDLQWAAQCDELEAHYQPLVALRTGRITGFEAVLRWRHPVKGLLLPNEFIGVAEESGLIVPIGAWALLQACLEGRRLQDAHPERGPLGMSVNVSTRQLQDPGLIRDVTAALDESGFDPRLLTLELTESGLVEDTEATMAGSGS